MGGPGMAGPRPGGAGSGFGPSQPQFSPRGAGPFPHRHPDPTAEPAWAARIRKQTEFYFSPDNVVGDAYLRGLMRPGGFVLLGQLAQFPRIAGITKDIGRILNAVSASPELEVLMPQSGDANFAVVRGRSSWHLAPSGPGAA